MTEWISTKDRLPNESKRYLCLLKWGGYQVCLWFGYEWCWGDRTYVCDDVTHWMELPEPPEGVSGNEDD